MEIHSKPVLIIGGSLVGLSSAMFLAQQGIPVIVIERHEGSSVHPRAIGYTSRTMEAFAEAGIISQIPQAPPTFKLRRTEVESLAGKWKESTDWTPVKEDVQKTPPPQVRYSPYTGAALPQDHLEPILRKRAAEFGADLRYSTELISFEQDNHGVTALVRERNGGKEYSIKAQYMIAADGSNSTVREKLGITRKGLGHLRTVRSVLFRAPLEEYLKSGILQFDINQPDFKAFLTTYNDGRWVLMFTDDEERTDEELKEAIFLSIGRRDLPIEMITTGRWELQAMIADYYSSGRVFLAGDAAHTLPPTRGGYGANTGIQDAHNIAWKLSSVLKGISRPELLDTYNAERQPIAWIRLVQTFARPDYVEYATEEIKNTPIIDENAMEFGQLYRSESIIGADASLPLAKRPDEWLGQPGTRAPHVWINKDGKQISTLDLFQNEWVLLVAQEQWKTIAIDAAKSIGVPLKCIVIGIDIEPDSKEELLHAFGLKENGATLVRPDGIVAWRSNEPTSTAAFASVFGQVSASIISAT